MRRIAAAPIVLALTASLAVAATPPDDGVVTAGATTVTDICGDPTDSDVMADAHDLCEVTMSVTTSEDPAFVPTVTVTATAAGAPVGPMRWTVGWSSGDCDYAIADESSTYDTTYTTAGGAAFHVACGPSGRSCISASLLGEELEVGCRDVPADEQRILIDHGTVDGSTVTWTLHLGDRLAVAADGHRPGAEVRPTHASIAVDEPGYGGLPVLMVFACSSTAGCADALGDLTLGGTSFVLPRGDG